MALLTLWEIMRSVQPWNMLWTAHVFGTMAAPLNRDAIVPAESKAGIRSMAVAIQQDCLTLGLRVTWASTHKIIKLCDNERATYAEFAQLCGEEFFGRLADEMAMTPFFTVAPNRADLLKLPNQFGKEVANRFPTAILDIEEAGKCLALERGTACVFHLMRILEIGLQELATKLDVSLAKDRNWQPIINDVNGAIKKLPSTTAAEKAYVGQCSEAAIHLQHVKDAWRNDVMHPRESYTPDQAEEVYDSSKRFMKSLTSFV